MPMYQNFNYSVKASLEATVNAVERVMTNNGWVITHEFDKFDMSIDFIRARKRGGLFGRVTAEDDHVDFSLTIRFRDLGIKTAVFLLSSLPGGDSVVSVTKQQDPEKKRILKEANETLMEAFSRL